MPTGPGMVRRLRPVRSKFGDGLSGEEVRIAVGQAFVVLQGVSVGGEKL